MSTDQAASNKAAFRRIFGFANGRIAEGWGTVEPPRALG
jgi:hypothetical protein